MSDHHHDVVIVGAGPAGSCAAYELASSGHSVAVLEEKSAPGVNPCCTGIISAECYDSLGLSREIILTEANSVSAFSPSGKRLRLETEQVQAYVVDRSLLDRSLAARAQSRGAVYFFSSPVTDVIPKDRGMLVEARCSAGRAEFAARAVILANGCRPRLAQRLGLGKTRSFVVGAQAELKIADISEVEVYFGRKVAPGSFAWLAPVPKGRAYAGLLAGSYARLHLQRFIDSLHRQGRAADPAVEIRQKAIPLGTPPRSYGDRVLAVGDAAGQVKPTTGGGIYFGHLGATIAAGVLDEALRADDLGADRLARYHELWKMKIGKELSRGYLARWAFSRLSDGQIERLFTLMDSSGAVAAVLESDDFSFDWHSKLVLTALRRSSAYPWLRIRHLLSRKAGS